MSVARRDQENPVLQRALERIRRAQQTGKPNVSLSHEEIAAIGGQSQSRDSPSPTKSGVKASSAKGTPNSAVRPRNKASSRQSLLAAAAAPSKTRPSKPGRKSDDATTGYASGAAPPGFVVQGPGGTPTYAPFGYYPAPHTPSSPSRRSSRSNSRSSSRHQRGTPPFEQQFQQYPRYYPEGYRPPSSSSRGSMPPDELDYYARPRTRQRSSSLAQQYAYGEHASAANQTPPLPAAQLAGAGPPYPTGRRIVSGPADVNYSPMTRRVPVPSARVPRGSSDPALAGYERTPSGLGRAVGSSSESPETSSDDGQGVQVDVVPETGGSGGNAYSVRTTPQQTATNGVNGWRRPKR